jgi:5-methyltetrahydrofolate--homocysteine methyltransferase
MQGLLADWLKDRDWLLADGAAGTNLMARGLPPGIAPELWNETHPAEIRRLHRDFIAAGADIILANSFGANAARLAVHDADERVRAISELAARHARAVAEEAPHRVLVAGTIGPTGEPAGALTEEEAAEIFAEQIAGLRDGGVDLIWIETMSAQAEMRAAATAAARAGLDCVLTASFGADGLTSAGLSPTAVAEAVLAFTPPPVAIGANCGTGPAGMLGTVLDMAAAFPDAILVAKANCGLPGAPAASPEAMGEYARLAVDAGARIVGGCCGTTATHLAAMRDALAGHVRRPRPDRAQILTALGTPAAAS